MPTTDYSGEWAYIDGVEEVTLKPRNPTIGEVTNVKALRGNPSRRDVAASQVIGITAVDQVFVLWSSTTSNYEPKAGDIIVDANEERWSIASVSTERFSSQYRATVVKEV